METDMSNSQTHVLHPISMMTPAYTVTALSRSLLIIGNVWKEMAWVCYSVM